MSSFEEARVSPLDWLVEGECWLDPERSGLEGEDESGAASCDNVGSRSESRDSAPCWRDFVSDGALADLLGGGGGKSLRRGRDEDRGGVGVPATVREMGLGVEVGLEEERTLVGVRGRSRESVVWPRTCPLRRVTVGVPSGELGKDDAAEPCRNAGRGGTKSIGDLRLEF